MDLPPNAVFAADEAVFMEEDELSAGLGPCLQRSGLCGLSRPHPLLAEPARSPNWRVGHLDGVGNFVNPTVTINDGGQHDSQPLTDQ